MTEMEPDWKAKITGPYDSFFWRYRVTFFKYDNGMDRWFRMNSWAFDPIFTITRVRAEKKARKRIKSWRKTRDAVSNLNTSTVQ